MEEYNEYGNLSGGYIFDYLDRKAYILAKTEIGKCVTLTGEIKYMGLVNNEDLENKTVYVCTLIGDNKILVDTDTDSKIFARFIFLKTKLGK